MSSLELNSRLALGFYPEREQERLSGFDRWFYDLTGVLAMQFNRGVSNIDRIVKQVDEHGRDFDEFSDEQLRERIINLRKQFVGRCFKQDLMASTFALIREVSTRLLGLRHFDVQLYGGYLMCQGMVTEMNTGEGKSLTATLPAITGALLGLPVHIVTVNDYLAQRDAEQMRPLYREFGLSVGTVVSGMSPEERRNAYNCAVTYCTNKELVFDYLKDRLAFGRKPSRERLNLEKLGRVGAQRESLLLRGLGMAVVDEADSILIDEARTPLIISGQGDTAYEARIYQQAIELARELSEGNDYHLKIAERQVSLSDDGRQRISELVEDLPGVWGGMTRREELIRQALSALHLFNLDRDYLIKDGRVQIIDEFTGRTMRDRSWEQGLHQLIEAKENCEMTTQKETLARISYQRFFRRYQFLSGMTGTAREVASELWAVYRLKTVTVPTHKPVIRSALSNRVVKNMDVKWEWVVQRIRQLHDLGRPVLVGTRSVEASELLSTKLEEAGLPHRVLNARQDKEEADIVSDAGQLGMITVATNMAGRGTDITVPDEVRSLGGLHVLATERHSAHRIDRQLFGRCGRQGDPGSYESIASLEDEVLSFYRDNWAGRMLVPLISEGKYWGQSLGRCYAAYCQWATERKHFRMRRELLDLDERLVDALAFTGQGE